MTGETPMPASEKPDEASSQKKTKMQDEGRKTYLLSPRAYEIVLEFKALAGRYAPSEFVSACICASGPSLISHYRDTPESDGEDASLKGLRAEMRKHNLASWRKRRSAVEQAAYAALVEKLRAAEALQQHQQFIKEAVSLPELKAQTLRDAVKRQKKLKKLKKTSRDEWAILLKYREEFLSL